MTPHPNNEILEHRLTSLGQTLLDDPTFVQRVLHQIDTDNIRPDPRASIHLWKWLVTSTIGLAAAILLTLAIWSLFIESAQPAYAIDTAPQRILSLNSLHIQGSFYLNGSALPLEVFAQQPDRCRINGRLDQSDPKNLKRTNVIITSGQRLILDPSAKTAMIIPENPEVAREEVAEILQSEVQMMFGAAKDYTKIRRETVNGIQTDVYETHVASIERVDIWFNPKTGLPVKTAVYRTDENHPPRLIGTFDVIDPNPNFDPSIFTPVIPADFKIINDKPTPPLMPEQTWGGGTLGHIHFCNRLLIALDDGNVLACWCLFDDQNPANDLSLPNAQTTTSIKTVDGISFSEHLLRADPTPVGFHWRWSLLHPTAPPRGGFLISWIVKHDRSSNQNIKVATSYKHEDLPDRVTNLQQLTLPPNAKPITLDQIMKAANP